MRPVVLLALAACAAVEPSDAVVLTDPATGAEVEIPAGALPAALSPDDVRLVVLTAAPAAFPDELGFGYAPVATLGVVDVSLRRPITVRLPVRAPGGRREGTIDPALATAVDRGDLDVLAHTPALAVVDLHDMAAHGQRFVQIEDVAPGLASAWRAMGSSAWGRNRLSSVRVAVRDVDPEIGAYRWEAGDDGLVVEFEADRLSTWSLVEIELDHDHNGIHDVLDGPDDLDADGVLNFDDWDDDGDRFADETEGTGDRDHDGTPAFHDLDRDGDGVGDDVACDAGGCVCGFRDDDGVRLLCSERAEIPCTDAHRVPGLQAEWIFGGACPLDTATTSCADEHGRDLVYYGPSPYPAEVGACSLCDEKLPAQGCL